MLFAMRFDLRNPALAGTSMAERYDTAIEIAEWADRLGCVSIAISEHHGSDDGYLPSPIPMIAAMGARGAPPVTRSRPCSTCPGACAPFAGRSG